MFALSFSLLMQSRAVREFPLELEHMDVYVVLSDGSFMVHVYMDEGVREQSGVYRYDASTGKFSRFCDGYAAREQEDFGAGLFSVTDDKARVDHYDIKTGKIVGSVEKQRFYARTGEWVAERPDYKRWEFRNVRTGKVVKSDVSSAVVWATPERLYLVERNIEQQPQPVDTYFELREMDATTLKTLRSLRFGKNELSDFRIVGDPTKPPFMIERSFVGVGVEAFDYDVIGPDWKRVGEGYRAVFGIRGDRFLTGIPLSNPDDTYTRSEGIECRSLATGAVVWSRNLGEAVQGAEWRGDEVWVGMQGRTVVLNAGNGTVRRTVEGNDLRLQRFQRAPKEWELKADSRQNTLSLVRNRV